MTTPSQHIDTPRVRFAPSPTGYLHIGGVRSAFYNLLFSKHHKGVCVLRIEDTDLERSRPEYEKDIRESFAWLGMEFDEGIMPDGSSRGMYGPYRQTERLDLYEAALTHLIHEDKAYYCFCSKEELETQKQHQEAEGNAPVYNGRCRAYSKEESARRLAAGEGAVIRLKVDAGHKTFTDLIRGEVSFDNLLIGVIVIAKGLREPLYNFAVVVDDETMKITHVIRGEEHLANTPKQLLIAAALGYDSPKYAHLPIILSATGKGKMSKRDGGTSVREYREAGYLPEALLNFLVLIGWHPVGDQEVMTFDEMVAAFSLERVQKGGAAFNKEKLDHFNQQYLKQKTNEELYELLRAGGFLTSTHLESVSKTKAALAVVRDRLVRLSDFASLVDFFFDLAVYSSELLVWKKGTPAGAREHLTRMSKYLTGLSSKDFVHDIVEKQWAIWAAEYGNGDIYWPFRVALSGKDQSPPPLEILMVLGRDEAVRRIQIAIEKLASLAPISS